MHHLKMAHSVPKDPDGQVIMHMYTFSTSEEARCHFKEQVILSYLEGAV